MRTPRFEQFVTTVAYAVGFAACTFTTLVLGYWLAFGGFPDSSMTALAPCFAYGFFVWYTMNDEFNRRIFKAALIPAPTIVFLKLSTYVNSMSIALAYGLGIVVAATSIKLNRKN